MLVFLAVLCFAQASFQSVQGQWMPLDPLRYPIRLTEFNETTLFWDDVVEYDPKGWPQFYPPNQNTTDWSATLSNVLYDSTNQIYVMTFDVNLITHLTLYNHSIWFVFFKGLSPKPFASLGPFTGLWIQDMVAGEAPGVAYVILNDKDAIGDTGQGYVSKLTLRSTPSLGPLIPIDCSPNHYNQATGAATFNLASRKILFQAMVVATGDYFLWSIDPASGKCTRALNMTPEDPLQDPSESLLSITTSGSDAAVLFYGGFRVGLMDVTSGTIKNTQPLCPSFGGPLGPTVTSDRVSGLGGWYSYCGNDLLPTFVVFDPYNSTTTFKPKRGDMKNGLHMVDVF